MTDEELADWTFFNWQARTQATVATPCEDCTDLFAAEMRALGLCTGFPGPQRYCGRCKRWWPDGPDHWLPFARGNRACYACRICRRRVRQARWYRTRYRTDPVFRGLELARKSLRYQRNRVAILARVHAARAKP
jgi:hypothetical protein